MFIDEYKPVELSDHEFAKHLREIDPHWEYIQMDGVMTKFKCHDKTVAVVRYKNDHPVGRQIWLRR